ncbi:haloacid dehalogenase [Amylibacter marinus]|uniref:Haloacid dehalogenase n=1 Tax=Amylibacter marinus TaxID=1475483 RepID=A0ABQ5VW18_9RHOB|nr:HAD family phosphatase [Amylibacter marinus]GLQ35633.1 haloacid dehalogenase [Amylibacter marinus]
MPIQAVIFDIGNVLIEWDPHRFYDSQIGAQARARFFTDTDIMAVHQRIDAGAPFQATVADLAARHPQWAGEIGLWYSHWNDMAGPTIEGSVALNRALRARGIATFALTNFNAEALAISDQKFPYLKEFDQRFVSGDLRLIKPDPKIYAHVEMALGLPVQDLLFVDDRPENIAAAQARGWRGHVFTDAQAWAECLVAHGLLNPEECP